MVVGLGVVAMNGAVWTDVACVSASVRSFPMDRGTAIGRLSPYSYIQLMPAPSTRLALEGRHLYSSNGRIRMWVCVKETKRADCQF